MYQIDNFTIVTILNLDVYICSLNNIYCTINATNQRTNLRFFNMETILLKACPEHTRHVECFNGRRDVSDVQRDAFVRDKPSVSSLMQSASH